MISARQYHTIKQGSKPMKGKKGGFKRTKAQQAQLNKENAAFEKKFNTWARSMYPRHIARKVFKEGTSGLTRKEIMEGRAHRKANKIKWHGLKYAAGGGSVHLGQQRNYDDGKFVALNCHAKRRPPTEHKIEQHKKEHRVLKQRDEMEALGASEDKKNRQRMLLSQASRMAH